MKACSKVDREMFIFLIKEALVGIAYFSPFLPLNANVMLITVFGLATSHIFDDGGKSQKITEMLVLIIGSSASSAGIAFAGVPMDKAKLRVIWQRTTTVWISENMIPWSHEYIGTSNTLEPLI